MTIVPWKAARPFILLLLHAEKCKNKSDSMHIRNENVNKMNTYDVNRWEAMWRLEPKVNCIFGAFFYLWISELKSLTNNQYKSVKNTYSRIAINKLK